MLNSTDQCKLFSYGSPKEDLHYRGSIFGSISRDFWEKESHRYLRFSESCQTCFWAYQTETCHFITLSCITAWNNWSWFVRFALTWSCSVEASDGTNREAPTHRIGRLRFDFCWLIIERNHKPMQHDRNRVISSGLWALNNTEFPAWWLHH